MHVKELWGTAVIEGSFYFFIEIIIRLVYLFNHHTTYNSIQIRCISAFDILNTTGQNIFFFIRFSRHPFAFSFEKTNTFVGFFFFNDWMACCTTFVIVITRNIIKGLCFTWLGARWSIIQKLCNWLKLNYNDFKRSEL